MKITDEQKERAAHVNLPQFLMSHGFELKKAGREYVWKEHDSVSIKDNAPGERGEWYRFSTDRGGDNISFLREFMGMGFVEAVEALNGESYNISYSAPQHTSQHKAQARELSLADADNAKRVFAYLCKTRGLDYDLVKELVQSGAVSQEEKTGNVLFKYFDKDNKVIGAEKVGTSTEHKFKGIATGSESGHGFEVCRGNGSHLLFFESSIDMLSYLQMHQSELTNHRLVSMMGVKPQTVIDTMERYGITPDRVYLCSDNDRAGNEFAERLMTEYPDMKRIVTPDTYKDWNDMLRGIPKHKEQENDKKEVRQTNMQIYGNKIWNDATDNRDKSIITVQAGDFAKLQEQLERAGINYCAYDRGNSVVIAVNDKDVAAFANAVGIPDIAPQKSNRPYTPPEKNIIGNAEYKYIPQKEYISADRDIVLKMADIMSRQNIRFSGRIYPTGKGTLTVSRPDLDRVKDIQSDLISRRSQAAVAEKGQIIGDRGSVTQNRHLYMSTLTPKQFEHINPFIDTNARYSAVVRDNKVMFSVDRSEAQAFHRALENAKREVGMLDSFAELGLPMEQMIALSPVIHRTAAEDVQLQLSDFFDKHYDTAQFGEMLSLVNAYLDQTPADRLGENSRLSEILEAKSSFDRAIELSDFFSQHDFSDEQRAAISAMFVGDITRGQLESIDETFTAEDIQAYDEILHNALQESDVADFLTAHKQAVIDRENAERVPTEEEVLFPQADLARFLAEHTLSSDEWEDMAYPLFERGYLDKHKPSENASFGYHLPEIELYALAERYHQGDDIRRELALGLLINKSDDNIVDKDKVDFVFEDGKISDRTFYYAENLRHTMNLAYGDDGITCSFGGMERFVSFDEIGQAFLDRTFEEFNDLAFWWVRDDMLDAIPDITDEKIADLITAFDGAAMHGWENGDNQVKVNRIKKALFDILGDEEQTEKAFAVIAKNEYNVSFDEPAKKESSIHFGLLGNGITAYDVSRTDPETHDYPMVAHISAEGVVKIYDENISAGDMERINAQAQSARDEFMSDWDKLSAVQQFQRLLDRADISTSVNISSEKSLSMEQKIEKYMPFVFFGEGERPEPEQVKAAAVKVSDLSVGDIIMYDGARREIEEISADRIKMKDLDAPDYGGILLSTSDVLAYDGWQENMESKGFEILSKAEKPTVETPEQAEPEDKGPVSLRKVGDFYEMYGKNAEIGAEVLGLRMLSKNGSPMVGFPAHVKDEYADKLREAGYSVLIEQAFELNPPKREAEKLQTLQQVVDKFFGTDCESAETERGTWKLAIADGDKVGELFYGGEPVCGIYNRGDKMEIEPYRELTTFPALLRTAMLEHNPDKPVEIMDFQRTFETPLDKAKWLINDFCEAEYREGADFDDLHNVGLAFTTLTDDELPIQVTADLVDFKITYEFDGEVYNTEQYDSIEDMIENGLTGLDFSDLVSVPDDVIERHTADRTTIYIESSEEDVAELREHLNMNGYDVVWSDDNKSFTADSEQAAYIETILEDRDIIYSLDGAAFDSPEQSVPLMSDASEVRDISSSDDVSSVTIKYKGDSESLDEIKDKALSLGATVIIDNAEGIISINTYENHTAELDGLAYELGIMRVDDTPAMETEEIDDDAPLFSDADVIEQIQADEKADTPFWETPDVQGEQLSLFGDPEPIQQTKPEKPKSEFAKGPFVDGVQVYEALAAEIDRGTGFQNGKRRVQDFYENNQPTTQELAEFLKGAYGIGGHTGEGNIAHVHTDSKGMTFDFENGEKFRHSWFNVAVMTESRLKDDTYLSAEQKAERAALKAEQTEEQPANTVEVGDKFRNKITGEISEVVSLTGVLPFYTDDCTVTTDKGSYSTTENISYDKLLHSGLYEYIGRTEQEKSQPEAVKPEPVKADAELKAEKPEIPTVKNLSQLKKALKPGMMFEITDHLRPECIGERRVVTGVNTVEFTSRKLDENGEPTGKDIYMEFDRAKNWSFDGGELTSRLDNGDMVMSFHFIDRLERTKEPEREPISENVIADNISEQEEAAPELSVGDIIEYKGKEYKVESLDMDGFITLNDTSFSGAVKDRVTFIADEFLKNAEYSIVTPDAPAPDKGDNFTITDDSLGEGGAKSKFRANVDAIRTLKTLEAENRPATAEEKETLSRYVGWGAIPQAFDKSADKWSAEYKELSELLTPEEYRQARSTVGDAFYTSPTVIDSIYEALSNFGFEGGNVLEPAMGVGNFFGCMPKEMQDNSQLYGVEIDSISGRIAQALYPDADIAISGFEKNNFQNGCFDVAVGNVPFGELGFKDEKHSTTKLHDYFFMEAMDKVKNGGIVAFVTSAGTLDKHDESTRQMLADKADLIGAIRLPGGKNGAFHDNAGTDVTTDIIFLQKREGKSVAEMSDIPDWVHIGETADGLPINQYFADNPDMVLGKVVEGNKLYGSGTMVVAEDGFDLKTALHEAVGKLSAEISHDKARDVYAKTEQGLAVKIPSDLRNFSFFMQDDQIFFKKNAVSFEQRFDKKNAQFGRYKAFIELRDITRELIQAQELNKPDSVIADLQAKLNASYDDFYKKYGLIHSKTNKRYFNEDISYNLVAGLEKKIDKDKLVEKSDIFTKRTICPPKAVECVETAMEALTLSIAEKARVDFEYMSKLTGLTEDELKHDLVGEIYKIPHTENTYQTASEYLSGDIRAKLREAEEAAEYDDDFNINVNALQKAMPEPLKAGDIDVKIGATWLDPKYYNQFMYELLGTDDSNRADKFHARWFKPKLIEAEYSEHSNSWFISNKKADRSVLVNQKYGSPKMNAYEIFEHLLNLKEPKIYKTIEVPDGMGDTKEKRVVDIDATRVVQKKAKEMRKAFKAWIFKDPERREAIVQRYNELFNSVRPREYDGSSLSFPMMNSSIHLHDHQKNAIAHAMFGGNTLFAHSVGAGKTFEMIATAMESKRLGLCTKSLFAVPNHLTEQIGDDFQRLYPSANILVATKKDFQKANRQQLFAKIATGNYDAVIIGHSQLGMIPVSKERQTMTIQSQIDDILEGIEELKKHEGSKFQIKAMERTRKSLQKQLDKLQKMNQDETLTFEQLGIDKLFVDECHEFKNLFTPSKMTNIAGISNSASQKALDLFLKCRYLDEKTGGRGITYATGTPLSNSVTELHTMMRYLEYDFLKDHGLQHFDNWVSVFGEQRTDWELAPAGNRFKERTRIATFSGLPELMSMFKQVADIRTADTLDLDVPDCEYKVVQVEATPFQKELVQELADRADAINGGNVDPSIDNMLKITSDGRKLGLDPRLIDPVFEDNPDTKLNRCVENVARIHAETAEDKLTQIIFCDLGVPHKSAEEVKYDEDGEVIFDDSKSAAERDSLEEECDFCVYTDIKDKLVAMGIPAEEIAFIHDAKTEKQKSELFEKVRSGEVRILLGSTAKMGTGTNVQDKLIAVHDLDIPWRPADLEQRAGRIIRQGNQNKNVEIYRYVTKGTFDAYSYQTLENKQKFISQIMTSKTPARRCEDVDQQALTYSEIKALCTGDERIKEKLMLDNDVKELKTLASEYANTVYEMQDKIKAFPMKEEQLTTALANLQADRAKLKALPIDPETKLPVFRMKIGETEYTDKKEAAKALEEASFSITRVDTPVVVGSFQGFELSMTLNSPSMGGGLNASMKGQHTHTAQLISSFAHNINRIEAGLYNIDRRIDQVKTNLSKLRVDYEEAQKIVSAPFPQQEELDSKSERLETLTQELNQAAVEAKKNAPKREQTCYFQRAQLKREAARIAKKKSAPKKTQTKDKNKPGLE